MVPAASRAFAGVPLRASPLPAATPADYRERVGVYVWGKLGGDLDSAVADVKKLGADHVARIYIGPAAPWDRPAKGEKLPLDVKVRRSDYRAFLAAFPVVM